MSSEDIQVTFKGETNAKSILICENLGQNIVKELVS